MPSPLPPLSPRCEPLAHPHWFPVTLASFLVAGIVCSYLPQHFRILSRKSSEGLSPWWVLLGGLSSIAAIGNILSLPGSREDLGCCREISGGACAAAFLGVVQIGCQWLCFMIIVLLYIVFFDYGGRVAEEEVEREDEEQEEERKVAKRYEPLVVGSVTFTCLLVVGIVSAVLVHGFPSRTQGWANTLGVIGGLMAMVQYVPQIYTTWKLKGARSLSIVTMMIQVPGAVVFAFSLWMRVGWEGWSTWIIFVITASLQSVVLALALIYSARSRSQGSEPDERTALLGSGGSNGRAT